jgi:hypothetical protein
LGDQVKEKEFLAGNDDEEKIVQMADGKFMSAFVRAREPAYSNRGISNADEHS